MPLTLGTSSIGSSVGLLGELGRLREMIDSTTERTYPKEFEALSALEDAARVSVERGAILSVR